MHSNPEANIATADVLTLLLHNQHALAAAIEELSLWVKANGSPETQSNVASSLSVIDLNASTITARILQLRQ